ncbi:MAG: Smr/MutS family protein [Acidobacteria bacterium]|nr:Smr/MutS family protein [Acidobacteriota bacterium]
MSLAIGTAVRVASLGGKRGVVVDAGHGGHYRVRVENVTVSCREPDLTPAVESGRKARRRPATADTAPAGSGDGPAAPAGRLDLHGLTVEEALQRVLEEIDHALRRGADRVEVVHGKGSGRIRAALHRQLATLPVVAAFRLDPRNPGVTWIYF